MSENTATSKGNENTSQAPNNIGKKEEEAGEWKIVYLVMNISEELKKMSGLDNGRKPADLSNGSLRKPKQEEHIQIVQNSLTQSNMEQEIAVQK